MNIENLFLVLVFFFIVIGGGYMIVRRVVKENRCLHLLALAPVTGISLFTVILSLQARFFGVSLSTMSTLFLFVIGGCTIFLFTSKATQLEWEIPKLRAFILIGFGLLLSAALFIYLVHFYSYDALDFLVAILAKQNTFPPHQPASPDAPMAYHFGGMLLAASLQIFTHLSSWYAFFPIQILFAFITPIAIFLLVFSMTSKWIPSLWASLTGIFSANLILFSFVISPTLRTIFALGYKVIRQFPDFLKIMNESGFTASGNKILASPHISIAMSLAYILFFLGARPFQAIKRYGLIIFFVSSYLYFVYEAYWFPVVFAILAYHGFQWLRHSQEERKEIFRGIFALVAMFLGGVLLTGGALFEKGSAVASLVMWAPKLFIHTWSGVLNIFYPQTWFDAHRLVSQADGIVTYKLPLFSTGFLGEFGLPIFVIPVMLLWWWKYKNRNSLIGAFFLGGCISFLVPFFIDYFHRNIETIRFFVFARLVFSILLGMFFGFLYERKQILAMFLLVITVVPSVLWMIPFTIPGDYRMAWIPKEDRTALTWLSHETKIGDRGVGPVDKPYKNLDMISSAGVFGVGVNKIAKLVFEAQTRMTALKTLNPCLLRELKVRWIYINPDNEKIVSSSALHRMQEEKMLGLRYEQGDASNRRRIYEFFPTSTASCKKDYGWAAGRLQDGKFQISRNGDNAPMIFQKTEDAFKALDFFKNSHAEDSYWYRVEAVSI